MTEGVGYVQRRGGTIEKIRPGDRVFIEPGEDHWHGATPDRLMVHLALNCVDDDHPAAEWGELVTDEEVSQLLADELWLEHGLDRLDSNGGDGS